MRKKNTKITLHNIQNRRKKNICVIKLKKKLELKADWIQLSIELSIEMKTHVENSRKAIATL